MADIDVDVEAVAVGLVVGWLLLLAGQRWVDDVVDDATDQFIEDTIEGATGGLIDV